MARTLVVAMLAVGFSAAMGSAAQAVVAPDPGTYYELFLPGVSSSECLDVPSGSTGVVAIQMFHCHGYASNGAPQLWNVFYVGNDGAGRPMYEIFNKAGKGCIQPRSTAFGSRIFQGICNGDPQQEWALVSPFDPNRFMLVNEWTGQCLTTNGSTANNTAVIQRTCDFDFYNSLQHWQLG
jgi:hypothetical protein